jgi:hypothetical protein
MAELFCECPMTTLDWLRVMVAMLGGITIGMVVPVLYRYRGLYSRNGTARLLHVVLISTSYTILVAALTYAQLLLIGQPTTRISWVGVIAMIVALPIGIVGLWLILGNAKRRKRAGE